MRTFFCLKNHCRVPQKLEDLAMENMSYCWYYWWGYWLVIIHTCNTLLLFRLNSVFLFIYILITFSKLNSSFSSTRAHNSMSLYLLSSGLGGELRRCRLPSPADLPFSKSQRPGDITGSYRRTNTGPPPWYRTTQETHFPAVWPHSQGRPPDSGLWSQRPSSCSSPEPGCSRYVKEGGWMDGWRMEGRMEWWINGGWSVRVYSWRLALTASIIFPVGNIFSSP